MGEATDLMDPAASAEMVRFFPTEKPQVLNGSQKLPQRLVASAAAAIAGDRRPRAITLGAAA
jgi:hypothetical protein